MGWVVSKPSKQNSDVNHDIDTIEENDISNAIIPLSILTSNSKQDNHKLLIDKIHPTNDMQATACDILIVDNDIEFFSSSNMIKSSLTNAESLYSIPIEINDHIELSNNVDEGNLENFAMSSSNKVIMCPEMKKKKILNRGKSKKNENKSNSSSKNIKLKHYDQLKKDMSNKILTTKKFTIKPDSMKCSMESGSELSRLSVTKKTIDRLKSPNKQLKKKFANKNSILKNSSHNNLPPLNVIPNKNERKSLNQKFGNKSQEENKKSIRNKTVGCNQATILRINEELNNIDERNISPNTVDDIERQLYANDCDLENLEINAEFIENRFRGFTDKKRPATAYSLSTNMKENFDNIIVNFNKKLEEIIKENHIRNCLCDICNKVYTDTKNKTTPGKITFFFLKKYGNLGKFILGRLNEFLDNLYQEDNQQNHLENYDKPFNNNFPLPCNINDIEYEGDLKSYGSLIKEGFIIKNKSSKSKLPKLIVKNRNKNFGNEIENIAIFESDRIDKNKTEETIIKKKIKFKKSEINKKSHDINLPPLKPASSIVNFCQTSKLEKSNNIVYKTLDLTTDQNSLSGFDYDLINVLYEDNKVFNNNVVQSCLYDSDLTDIDGCSVGIRNSIKFDDKNEEDISILANKLIDELWKNNLINSCQTKPIVSD